MPTPFMHMAFAQRVVDDPALSSGARMLISAEWGAFLLGNIAPDARVSSGIRRADTHFFEYEPVIVVPPDAAMQQQYPALARNAVTEGGQAAFVAGYIAHLTMDALWCTDLLFPHFMNGSWDDKFVSFQMLHMLLGTLDARDHDTLPADQYPALAAAAPRDWLPFISDEGLIVWRDTIADQIAPGSHSRTLEILAQRIKMDEADMRAFIESTDDMARVLWAHLPREIVARTEVHMYDAARAALIDYLG